jgi:alpha-glucosidase
VGAAAKAHSPFHSDPARATAGWASNAQSTTGPEPYWICWRTVCLTLHGPETLRDGLRRAVQDWDDARRGGLAASSYAREWLQVRAGLSEEESMLDQPHHDGSPLHVPSKEPSLDQTIPVFVRVPYTWKATAVHLRCVYDGEPQVLPAVADRNDAHDVWWRADLPVHNPVTCYRFKLDRGPGRSVWLNSSGLWNHEVTDAADFRVTTFPPPPAWVADAVLYEIFLDRFARSVEAPAATTDNPPAWAIPAAWDDPVISAPGALRQLYGGDLRGIEERLDYLQRLGVNVLYLTPFFPAPSNHRYNATTFNHVDPLLGGDAALASLASAAHRRGMRLLGDLTTNHSGSTHEWFRAAQADPASEEAGYYYFRGHANDYIAWYADPTLPKFNFASIGLRRRLVDGPGSVVARWLRAPYALDGWRIDAANTTGRWGADDFNREIATTIRATIAAQRPDAFLLAEHAHDAAADLLGDGWHATMNYAGFTSPVRSWLAQPARRARPAPSLPCAGPQIVRTMRELPARVAWRVAATNVNLLSSHDTTRIRSAVSSDDRAAVAAGLLFSYLGAPMVYMGDELGLQAANREQARIPMPWANSAVFASSLAAAYRELITLRHTQPALRHGGLRWAHVSADAIAFLRETPADRLLVLATRANGPAIRLPATIARAEPANLYGGATIARVHDELVLPGDGPTFQVWSL